MNPSAAFFVTGGTLPIGALSYVTRQADEDLLSALEQHEFCYVLNTRQMGKSSLCVQTITKLQEQGTRTIFLDLTRYGGASVIPDQWYAGMLLDAGEALDLRAEFLAYFKQNKEQPLVQRFIGALQDIALPADSSPLVVFIDEVDAVRSLPFNTDEFFAAIRACYNQRAEKPELEQLTFCLIGVATPADLISNARVSPFNVGKRIQINDFTASEANVLAAGMGGNGSALLSRILHWTSGHPYLTQRLCRTATEQGLATPTQVDALVGELFLGRQARTSDDNLSFVRKRVLESGQDLTSLLEMYGKVHQGKPVLDDETNALCSTLRLSGVVVADAKMGLFRVRNRIYERVFDANWIKESLPDAELRRQRAAVAKARWQIGSIAGVVLLAMAGLLWRTSRAEQRASRETIKATRAALQERLAKADAQGQARLAVAAKNQAQATAAKLQMALRGEAAAKTSAQKQALLATQATAVAQEQKRRADVQTNIALGRAETVSRLAYANLAQSIMDHQDHGVDPASVSEMGRLLKQNLRLKPGYEWTYLNELLHLERFQLKGHTAPVTSAIFSSDGKRIITASKDKTAQVWDAATGKPLLQLKGHTGPVTSASFSSDGGRILTASKDKTARVWDASTGRPLLQLKESEKASHNILHAIFSPNGKRILIASGDREAANTAHIWDAVTGQEIFALEEPGYFYEVTFSQDGRRILTSARTLTSGEDSSTAHVWDASTGRKLFTLPGLINSAQFSPDGTQIVAGCGEWGRLGGFKGDTTARIWDVASGRELRQFEHPDGVTSAVFSPDGKRILTGCFDGSAHIWEVSTGRELRQLIGPNSKKMPDVVAAFNFSPDGKWATTLSYDFATENQSLCLWDAASGREVLRINRPTPVSNDSFLNRNVIGGFSPNGRRIIEVSSVGIARVWDVSICREFLTLKGYVVAFFPDGKRIVTGCEDHTARVWDAMTGELRFKLRGDNNSVACSPDGRRIVTGCNDHTARVWDATTGRELLILQDTEQVSSVAFSADSKRILTGSFNHAPAETRVWDAVTGRKLLTLKARNFVTSVAFSADGRYIVTGEKDTGPPYFPNQDNPARVWDAVTGKEIQEFKHTAWVTSVAFSPDGKRILTGSADKTARVWDIATGRELMVLKGHDGSVTAVAYSPDGKQILTGEGASNNTSLIYGSLVYVWDAVTGRKLLKLKGHTAPIRSVAFSADGQRIASASEDGTARIWRRLSDAQMAGAERAENNREVRRTSDGEELLKKLKDAPLSEVKVQAERLVADFPQLEYGLANELNRRAWEAIDPAKPRPSLSIAQQAREIAALAVQITKGKNGLFLDTLAATRFGCGDLAGALDAQRKAAKLLPKDQDIAAALARYEKLWAEKARGPK